MQQTSKNKTTQNTCQNSGESQRLWLESMLGQYVLAREQAMFDAVVSDVFGFNALQLGMLQLDALKSSRIPHLIHVGNREGDTLCESDYLPFAESCIDLVCLPHVLEFSRNPHQTLRETERVLVPEGHLILTGFNPISAWGIKQVLTKDKGSAQEVHYPWQGHFFTLSRIKDWLALLGLEYVSGSMNAYEPPINDEEWLKRFEFVGKLGKQWWPMLGGVYFIVAKKRVVNMTLLKPNWKKNALQQKLAVSNNPKSKPTQYRSTQQKVNNDSTSRNLR